jgi:hypothetical protein
MGKDVEGSDGGLTDIAKTDYKITAYDKDKENNIDIEGRN